jgi:hypothetical protein
MGGNMKNPTKKHNIKTKHIVCLAFILLLALSSACATKGSYSKGDITADGLTVIKSTRLTEQQIKKGVDWSEYTSYLITPAEVEFRKNWKRDQNSSKGLSRQVQDDDMARIREGMGKLVYEEFDKALQEKSGLKKTDAPQSNTLLFKPVINNLDVYAPDIQSAAMTTSYIRQAGRATLFLEVHDAVSGELLARWVDTREDPDRGYAEWANRITNEARARTIVKGWAKRLIEGLEILRAIN